MQYGRVKWFNPLRGYGFIETDVPVPGKPPERPDVFVYHRDILMPGYRTLREGQRVSFVLEPTAKGAKAVCVKPLGGGLL